MKKKKLQLEEIKIKGFVTTVYGGARQEQDSDGDHCRDTYYSCYVCL